MKLIFCDLDGTLIFKNSYMQLVQTKKILPQLEKAGFVFCVSSGRAYFELKNMFSGTDIYYCANDGALCMKNNEFVFDFPIEKSLIPKNLTDFVAYGRCVAYAKSKDERKIRQIKKAYDGFVCEIDDAEEIPENILKLALYGEKPQNLNESFNIIYDKNGITELVKKDCDKGVSAKALAKMLSVAKEDILAFGDNFNDLPLFEAAGTSFAPKSADIRIKQAADYECTAVSDTLKKLMERK